MTTCRIVKINHDRFRETTTSDPLAPDLISVRLDPLAPEPPPLSSLRLPILTLLLAILLFLDLSCS